MLKKLKGYLYEFLINSKINIYVKEMEKQI